ncbi:MAG: right-handed parallel beta-helix repeat-containing protein [Janthinobacterium lividum]
MKNIFTSLALGLLALTALPGRATTFYQSAPSSNSAFQGLVDQAQAGDVIVLRVGSHYVTTPIRLPAGKDGITIRGEAGAVVRKAPNAYNAAAFEITGNNNTLDLLELDGGNLPEAGIIIYGQHNTVSNSLVHNCGSAAALGAGILLDGGHTVCAFNTVIGCKVYYNYMVGVSQYAHSDGTVRDNQIYENGAEGLTVDIRSHNNLIANNYIHLNNTDDRGVGGVGTDASNGNRFDGNTIDFTHFRSGLTFQNNIGGCDGVIVANNHINNNDGYGILERFVQYADTHMTFTNNELLNNKLGGQAIVYADHTVLARLAPAPAGALALYPNPAQDALALDLGPAPAVADVAVHDLQGRLVQRQTLRGPGTAPLAGVRALPNGAYLVTITTAGTVATRKLVVAH